MTSVPPPYAPGETKGLYPSVQGDPQQQPVVYTTPGTAAVTYYPSGPVQQQQPQQLIITQPAPPHQQPPSFVCHILFSCCVTCFCFWPFGLVAFTLAMIGYCQANSSPTSARKLGTASIVFSIVSGILGLLIVIVVIGIYGDLFVPELIAIIEGCHDVNGVCWRKKSDLSKIKCEEYASFDYDNGFCYHN